MAATVTATGVVGPNISMAARVFSNVTLFFIDAVNNLLAMDYTDAGGKPYKTAQATIDINAATTVTATKSGKVWTLTIS